MFKQSWTLQHYPIGITCINRKSLPTWEGQSIESRNPSTPENHHCNHHYYSGISLPSVVFLFQIFYVSLFVCVGFSKICFTRLHNFGAWINFIENYPEHLVLLLRSLRPYSRDLPIQYPNPSTKYPRTTIMAHKNATRHDANDPGEIDPSVLSYGQLIQM